MLAPCAGFPHAPFAPLFSPFPFLSLHLARAMLTLHSSLIFCSRISLLSNLTPPTLPPHRIITTLPPRKPDFSLHPPTTLAIPHFLPHPAFSQPSPKPPFLSLLHRQPQPTMFILDTIITPLSPIAQTKMPNPPYKRRKKLRLVILMPKITFYCYKKSQLP